MAAEAAEGKIEMNAVAVSLGARGEALVDAGDYSRVRRFTWTGTEAGAVASIGGKRVLLHRFILDAPSGKNVVHLNSNKLDCRRDNLLLVEQGLQAYVDRNAYGIRSMLPLTHYLDVLEIEMGRQPSDLEEAVRIKNILDERVKRIKLALGDSSLTAHLSPRERDKWRGQLIAMKNLKEAYLREINLFIQHHRPMQSRSKRDAKELHERRVRASTLTEVERRDPMALIRALINVNYLLGARLDYQLTDHEQGVIDAAKEYIDLLEKGD